MVSRQWRRQEGCCWLHHCQIAWSADIHQDINNGTDKELSSLLWGSHSSSLCLALLLIGHRKFSRLSWSSPRWDTDFGDSVGTLLTVHLVMQKTPEVLIICFPESRGSIVAKCLLKSANGPLSHMERDGRRGKLQLLFITLLTPCTL